MEPIALTFSWLWCRANRLEKDQIQISISTPSVFKMQDYLVIIYLFLSKENKLEAALFHPPSFFLIEKSCSNLPSLVPSIKQGMTVEAEHVRPLQGHSDSTKTQQLSPRWGCVFFLQQEKEACCVSRNFCNCWVFKKKLQYL